MASNQQNFVQSTNVSTRLFKKVVVEVIFLAKTLLLHSSRGRPPNEMLNAELWRHMMWERNGSSTGLNSSDLTVSSGVV